MNMEPEEKIKCLLCSPFAWWAQLIIWESTLSIVQVNTQKASLWLLTRGQPYFGEKVNTSMLLKFSNRFKFSLVLVGSLLYRRGIHDPMFVRWVSSLWTQNRNVFLNGGCLCRGRGSNFVFFEHQLANVILLMVQYSWGECHPYGHRIGMFSWSSMCLHRWERGYNFFFFELQLANVIPSLVLPMGICTDFYFSLLWRLSKFCALTQISSP